MSCRPLGRRWVAAAAVSLLAVLAACSGDDESSETEHASYEPLTKETFGPAVSKAMAENGTVHVSGDMGGPDLDLWMEIGGKDAAMKGDLGDTALLLVDGDLYVRESSAAKWDRMPAGFSTMMTSLLEDVSPETMATDYAESLVALDYEGEEKIKGVELHAYRLTLDEEYVRKQVGAEAAELGADPGALAGGDLPAMEFATLLDGDDLMRQVEISIAGQTMVMTMDQWGEDVEIEAPPANEVQELRP
ncbi:hypothetical protein ACIA03_16005 [Nocardioides sp. NPDC051685]|uniref:hypothetical protein n=1 Tax=Nocardioides sp. NPDC051685 TaxID=3364334 RepID=UPI003788B5A2